MIQEYEWDREYRQSKFLTKENKPQSDVIKFVSFLKKNKLKIENKRVLDLGSGIGRNSFYFAQLGASVTGFEISNTAIKIAKNNSAKNNLFIDYKKQSIGEIFPVEDNSIDIVLDITSSNSLSESEREIYLLETKRVMREGGYFFVKALCKDGDQNAKKLLKTFPAKEKDTYIMPETNITEKVWSKEDFLNTYQKFFQIVSIVKKTNYTRMNNRSYKRNFWLAYMKK